MQKLITLQLWIGGSNKYKWYKISGIWIPYTKYSKNIWNNFSRTKENRKGSANTFATVTPHSRNDDQSFGTSSFFFQTCGNVVLSVEIFDKLANQIHLRENEFSNSFGVHENTMSYNNIFPPSPKSIELWVQHEF